MFQLGIWAQIPTDDPVEAQLKWYERQFERPDLIPGAFEVVRFPTGYKYEPKYEHDRKSKKRILNPDFYCTQCVREKRIDGQNRRSYRLMEQEEEEVMDFLHTVSKRRPIFLEDRQFRMFIGLDGINAKKHRNPFLKEELVELADIFPKVNERTVALNKHQVAHLYLIRANRLLRDFCWLVGNNQEQISEKWPHLGDYLGMKNRLEVYIFRRQREYFQWAIRYIGRGSEHGQCWHMFNDRMMVLGMHAQNQEDPQTTNFMFHRLTHNMLDAYRMYSFKLPAWFQMGMGHWVERRESRNWNSFCYSEGELPKVLFTTKWCPKIKKMVRKGKLEPFVSLCSNDEYAQLPFEYHLVSWSWVCYLWRLGPEKMPLFINELKNKKEGETLYQAQIRAFQKAYGITLLQFEAGWKEWVLSIYPDV